MIRFSTIFLCAVLFVAAAGRYKAETAVREVDKKIAQLKEEQKKELREFQILRTELALLESPDRLAELARAHTDLVPASGAQMMTAEDFLLAFGGHPAADKNSGDNGGFEQVPGPLFGKTAETPHNRKIRLHQPGGREPSKRARVARADGDLN
ncbi:MAG: hypothetical protein AAF720_00380 [Pseudomonadota bacterium]